MGICITPGTTRRRKTTVRKQTGRSGRSISGLWYLGTVFASARAEAETGHKCHRGQARRARQEPDGQRFEREIRVFPALALTVIKNYKRHNLQTRLSWLRGDVS